MKINQQNLINKVSKFIFITYLIIFASTIVSCNYFQEKSLPTVTTSEPGNNQKLEKIAVLPFVNLTEVPDVNTALRINFLSLLSSKGYTMIKLGEVDHSLEMADIDLSNIEKIDPYKLGRILKADALIYGTITKCSKMFAAIYSNVAVGAQVRMVEVETAKTIWAAEHIEKTHGGGSPSISPFSIPEQVVESVLNIRDKVINDTAENLAKKFIDLMPENPFEVAPETEIISIIKFNDKRLVNYTIQAGDSLYKIANKFYGEGSKWEEIKMENKELQGSSINVGQHIVIPNVPILNNLSEIDSFRNNIDIKKVLYKVKWGDSLFNMAFVLYGDGKKWETIFENNRSSIVSETDVPVGQILILPLSQ